MTYGIMQPRWSPPQFEANGHVLGDLTGFCTIRDFASLVKPLIWCSLRARDPRARLVENFVPLLDDLERKWILKCQTTAIRRRLEITSEGLLFGAGTCLAKMIRDAGGASVLALDGQGSRIIALLSVAYERAVPVSVMDTLRKASDLWSRGEKALAHVHLSFCRAPPFETNEQAFRLFAANELLEAGMSPRRLMKALDLDPAPLDSLQKYNPDQPRVPAGSTTIFPRMHGRS